MLAVVFKLIFNYLVKVCLKNAEIRHKFVVNEKRLADTRTNTIQTLPGWLSRKYFRPRPSLRAKTGLLVDFYRLRIVLFIECYCGRREFWHSFGIWLEACNHEFLLGHNCLFVFAERYLNNLESALVNLQKRAFSYLRPDLLFQWFCVLDCNVIDSSGRRRLFFIF